MKQAPQRRELAFALVARFWAIAASLLILLIVGASPAFAAGTEPATLDSSTPAAEAVAAGPTMTVKPGFNGMSKIGDWLPVNIQLANDGPSVAGQIEIQIDDNLSGLNRIRSLTFRPATRYTVQATLPSHSRKQYQVDVFLPMIARSLTAKLVTNQGVSVEQTGQLQALSGSDVLCGTLAQNQDFYQQLKNVDLPGRQGKKPFVAPLNLADLPLRQQALSSLDCLILDNTALSGLTDDQKSALTGWVEDGGLLVLGGGTGWQKTLQPLPKELLPVDVRGVRAVPSLRALEDFARQPIKGDGPWLVSAGNVVDGTTVLQENGIPLLVAARRGKGNVVFLAADPSAEPLNTWSGNGALWKYILAYANTPIAVYPFFNAFGGFNAIQNWGVPPRGAIYDISAIDPPSQRWFWLFLGLYAFVAAPLNYLVLRLVDRRELAWLTIPLCIALGAAISFQFAQRYQGADFILNKISIIRADGNSALANVRSYVALYAPRGGNFQASLPGTAAITSFAPPARAQAAIRDRESTRPWELDVAEGESSNRVDLPLEEANTGTFFSDSQVRLAGRFDSTLKVEGNIISGKISNHTGQSVNDVMLALGQDVARLGSMRSGQTKDVRFTFDPAAPSSSPNPTAIKAALAEGKPQDATMTNELSVIDGFLGSNTGTQPAGLSGLILMGWLEKSPLPLDIAGVHPTVKETNFYVSSVALAFPRGQPVVVPSALIETKQIGSFSTTFQRTGQYELNPSGSLALEFDLPVSYSSMTSHRLVLHMVGHYSGNRGPASGQPGSGLGQISIYNWQSFNWDSQDLVWGDNVISEPDQHLSATATVRVRFTYKPPMPQAATSIQFSLDLTDQGQTR